MKGCQKFLMLWSVIFVITLQFDDILSVKPGFQARITDKGLKYASTSAINALSKKLNGQKIPDQSGKSGGVSYTVSSMVITSFTKPASNIAVVPSTGLKWSVNGAGISMKGNWKYQYKKGWFKVSDHGRFDASVNGITFSLTMAIGKDGNGRPKISASGCSCDVSSVHIKFHGGASWIYNIFSGVIERKLKGILKSKMCSEAVDAVNTDGEKEMKKIPVNVELAKKFLLDYSLISSPSFSNSYMQTFHKGEIYWKGGKEDIPFQPADIPAIKSSSKMVYLWLSDYMANSMGYTAYKNSYLKYNLTAKDLPAGNRSILNTTCSGLFCIGKLIPQIGEKYPNCVVQVNMVANSAPKMVISPQAIQVDASGVLDLYAKKQSSPDIFLIKLNMTLGIDLKASLKGEILYTEVSNPRLIIGVLKSAVGVVSGPVIQSLIKFGVQLVVIPKLNNIGAKGLSLPITKEIKFKNSELILQKDSLMIASDIAYIPPKGDTPVTVSDLTELPHLNLKLDHMGKWYQLANKLKKPNTLNHVMEPLSQHNRKPSFQFIGNRFKNIMKPLLK
ncbi:hypothetical protein LOTGIDRAFT_231708 [Lottia gigantea]|uniref:Bactericidal permeability-increasing protein n=1 Tax=Lottia gigantea TaxID=225164 RepID=V4C5M9_LOTGI|nr:hypothetical protein LOTGIDRAFT_231708 [Lottia gigantea]ESO96904.1 hypothetical protein LOTGIDRAFT_231708 [Lottia gigantea]